MALEGHTVTFVTALDEVSPTSVERYEGTLVRRRLHELEIAMHRRTTLTAVHEDRVEARDEFGVPLVFDTTALVLLSHRVSNDGLYRDLIADPQVLAAEEIEAVYRGGGAGRRRHLRRPPPGPRNRRSKPRNPLAIQERAGLRCRCGRVTAGMPQQYSSDTGR